ncbi:MAG: class I SAM-dependent methyltransferase [Acidobacteriaceae bacterium]
MRPVRDPEGEELKHLLSACRLKGKDVLEIGIGDGLLMRQYAAEPRMTFGIDPEASDLQVARQEAETQCQRVCLTTARGEKLPFPSQKFDIALFACSL